MKRQPPRQPQQSRPPPRWAIGTGQLSCLQFRSGPIARRGGRRYNTIFYICCVRQDMWVLYESLTNILKSKDFRFSLWQVFLPCMLYEKAASKATSAEPPPPPMGNRNRTIELSTVPVRAHCPSGGRRYNTIFYICCVRQDMPVYMKVPGVRHRSFNIGCGQT